MYVKRQASKRQQHCRDSRQMGYISGSNQSCSSPLPSASDPAKVTDFSLLFYHQFFVPQPLQQRYKINPYLI